MGHLTSAEEKHLSYFLGKYDWTGEYGDLLQPGETPETCALRWLRARQFDRDAASAMVEAHVQWRKSFQVDAKAASTDEEIFGCDFESCILPYYPQGFCGEDRQGRLVYVKLVGELNVPALLENTTVEKFVAWEVSQLEVGKWYHGVQRAKVGYHCEECFTILDMGGFNLSFLSPQVWSFVRSIAAECGDNYPETNGGMMIINAPWVFTFAWKIVTTFLDPGTLAKINILGSDYQEELLNLIEKDQIPREYGGTGKSIKEICYSKQSRAFIPTERPSGDVALKGDFMYCQEVASRENERTGGKGKEIEKVEGNRELREAKDSEEEVQPILEEHMQEPGITGTMVHTVSDDLSTDRSLERNVDEKSEQVAATTSATTAGPKLRKWDLVKFVAAPEPKKSDQLSSVVESMMRAESVTSLGQVDVVISSVESKTVQDAVEDTSALTVEEHAHTLMPTTSDENRDFDTTEKDADIAFTKDAMHGEPNAAFSSEEEPADLMVTNAFDDNEQQESHGTGYCTMEKHKLQLRLDTVEMDARIGTTTEDEEPESATDHAKEEDKQLRLDIVEKDARIGITTEDEEPESASDRDNDDDHLEYLKRLAGSTAYTPTKHPVGGHRFQGFEDSDGNSGCRIQ